ncbi:hypothetical protein BGZ99_001846 [Dissophora globulifera]|uniref:Uncharacterized protein n=1 Tax=Dissophora globulifera TaxID=979702 RepID=A0A9P6RU36_9FUNG|nr:hypothetical protein BGZ99_001846 [Dissophora globulifera]
MPHSLSDIESTAPQILRIENIHEAIVEEVRENQNWENAYTLFTHYLAPVILASERAAALNIAPAEVSHVTSRVVDFEDDAQGGKSRKTLTSRDISLAQRSLCAMVRYAPSPDQSNIIYMFYLQREPPLRNDDTTNHCLISLIYQYAQQRQKPDVQAKGLDLIKVALERGLGLPSYEAVPKHGRYADSKPRGSILTSVSRPILVLVKQRITQDGRRLEPFVWPQSNKARPDRQLRPQNQHYQHGSQPRFHQQPLRPQQQLVSQQQQQQQPQQQQQQPLSPQQQQQQQRRQAPQQTQISVPQSQQNQQPHLTPQSQHHRGSTRSGLPGRHGRQEHDVQQVIQKPQDGVNTVKEQQNPTGDDSSELPQMPETASGEGSLPQQQKKKYKAKDVKKKGLVTADPEPSSGAPSFSAATEDMDQYTYYKQASRRGFAGAGRGRDHAGGSGSSYGARGSSAAVGGHRTIAFVPASYNPMLKTDDQPRMDNNISKTVSPDIARVGQEAIDPVHDLAADIGKLQLEGQSA